MNQPTTVISGLPSAEAHADADPAGDGRAAPIVAAAGGGTAPGLVDGDVVLRHRGDIEESVPLEVREVFVGRIQLAFEGYSPNTQKQFLASCRSWWAYSREHGLPLLPTDLQDLTPFLRDTARDHKRSTLQAYLFMLDRLYRWSGVPSPLQTIDGRLLVKAVRKTASTGKNKRVRQKKGFGMEQLDVVLDAMSETDPRDVRDRALLSVIYETLMRRSELTSLVVDDFEVHKDGTAEMHLQSSKTDQDGKGKRLPITRETAQMVRAWLDLAGITEGPIWRSIPLAWHRKQMYASPLGAAEVARIIKRRCRQVGIDSTLFSGHSPRIGAAQDLVAHGATDPQVMQAGRWRSLEQVVGYTQHLRSKDNAMMKMLGRKGKGVPRGGNSKLPASDAD